MTARPRVPRGQRKECRAGPPIARLETRWAAPCPPPLRPSAVRAGHARAAALAHAVHAVWRGGA